MLFYNHRAPRQNVLLIMTHCTDRIIAAQISWSLRGTFGRNSEYLNRCTVQKGNTLLAAVTASHQYLYAPKDSFYEEFAAFAHGLQCRYGMRQAGRTGLPGPMRSLAKSFLIGLVSLSFVDPSSVNSPERMRSSSLLAEDESDLLPLSACCALLIFCRLWALNGLTRTGRVLGRITKGEASGG